MLHASTKRLIDTLGDRTRKQRVSWVETDDGSVTHDTEGYRVIITPEPHTVLITDALGKELDEVTPDEYADAKDADGRPYAMFMNELFREASRHARGTERAIEALLAGLDTDGDGIPDTPVAEADPQIEDIIEDIGDETNIAEDQTTLEMKNAVANLADQVNVQSPDAVEAPEPAETTSKFGAAAAALAAGGAATAAAATVGVGEDTPPLETTSALLPDAGTSPEAPLEVDPATLQPVDALDAAVPPEPAPARSLTMSTGFGDVVEYKSDDPSAAEVTESPTGHPSSDSPLERSMPPESPPRSFSLSGIGTGFGLGATTGAVAANTQNDEIDRPEADEALHPAHDALDATEEVAVGYVDGTSDLPDEPLLPNGLDDVGATLGAGVESARDQVGDVAEEVADSAASTLEAARGGAGGVLGGLASKATDGMDAIKDTAESAVDTASDLAEDAVETVKPATKPSKRFNPWT